MNNFHRPPLLLPLLLLLAVALSGAASSAARGSRNPATANPASSSCELCLDAVALLTRTLADTPAVVELMQRQLCPSAADEHQCRQSVGSVLPVLLTVFKASAAPGSLCSAPSACGDGVLHGASGYDLLLPGSHQGGSNSLLQGGPTCALCSFLVNRVKAMLNDTSVQESILAMSVRVCSTLPTEFSKSCVDFVQTYEPMLTKWVLAIDSIEMCFFAGVCLFDSSQGSPRAAAGAAAGAGSAHLLHLPPALAAALGGLHRMLLKGPAANDACDVCKATVTEAHDIVANPNTQEALINYTRALCTFAGGPLTKDCQDLVDTYAPDVFTYLEAVLSPTDLCTQLGACRPSLQQRWRQQAELIVSKLQEQVSASLPQQQDASEQQAPQTS